MRNKILIEKGIINNKKDIILEKDLHYTQINYILNNIDDGNLKTINKYDVANYYFQLAKQFNSIALERKLSRYELWNIIKKSSFRSSIPLLTVIYLEETN